MRTASVASLAILLALAPVGACRGRSPEPAAAPPRAPTRPAATAAAPREAPVVLYDAEGYLLPSGERFLGFELPRGFRRTDSVGGLFIYESSTVPLGKLRAYVARRVLTTVIEDIGTSGYVFRNAAVSGAEATDHRLDVFVSTISGGVQLRLQDIPPPAIAPGTTPQDREREVQEAWRRQAE